MSNLYFEKWCKNEQTLCYNGMLMVHELSLQRPLIRSFKVLMAFKNILISLISNKSIGGVLVCKHFIFE